MSGTVTASGRGVDISSLDAWGNKAHAALDLLTS